MDPPPGDTSIVLAVLTGLGLAAACGFRVFLPLFAAALAGRLELLRFHADFAWLGGDLALLVFGVATLLEVGAYLVPFVDNFLDTIATPAAALAGTLVSLAVLVELDPALRWSLALVAGAGLATAVQVPTAALRGGSSLVTGGLANAGLALGELVGALLLAAVSVLAPIAVPLLLVALAVGAIRLWRRRKERRSAVS